MSKNSADSKGRVLGFDKDHCFYAKRGDAKRMQNNPVDAIAMYRQALERNPLDYETRIAMAGSLSEIGRFDESNALVITVINEDEWFKTEALYLLGFNYLGLEENQAAGDCFEKFFARTDEVSARTDAILDAMDRVNELYDDDEPELSDAVEDKIMKASYESRRLFGEQNYDAAVEKLENVLEDAPDDIEIRFNIALSLLCAKRTDECTEQVEKILEKDPSYAPALCLKLVILKNGGSPKEIEDVCTQIEQCEITDWRNLLHAAATMCETGMYDKAMIYAKRMIAIAPYESETNHLLAQCYIYEKQYRKAISIYDKLLKINANDYIAKTYRSRCIAADKGLSELEPAANYQLQTMSTVYYADKIMRFQKSSEKTLIKAWKTDPDLYYAVLHIMTLNQFELSYAMIGLLSCIKDTRAEYCLREFLLYPDLSDTLINCAITTLKDMNAAEPYYILHDGSFLESAIKLVDMSGTNIPKNYRDICPRCREKMENMFSIEVVTTMSQLVERYISTVKTLPHITEDQSIAMSAAFEYIACRRCNIDYDPNICEKYGVTSRRLSISLKKIIDAIFASNEEDDNMEDD